MPDLELVDEKPISPTVVKKSEIDNKAEEMKLKATLPKKPGDRVSFNQMCEWLQLLDTEEKKSRVLLYVYRIEPVINRQLVDPQASNSVDVISDGFERLTEDYFANTHGGGKYKIIVFDAGNKELQRNGFFSANLSIPMLDCPPKLDLREVVWTESKNKGYQAWCRGQKLIDENNMPTIEGKSVSGVQPANSSDAMVQAMKLAMDFASKMDEKQQLQLKRQLGAEDSLGKGIGEILLEKMKQEDPNKQLQTFSTLITAMKSMQPEVKQTSEITAIMPLFVAMMESSKSQTMVLVESMKSQMTMMVEMMKSNKGDGEERGSGVSQLKELIEVARMMKGNANAPEKSMGEQIVEAASTIIPGALNLINNVMAINAHAKGVAGVTATPTPPPNNTVEITQGRQIAQVQPQQQANNDMTLTTKQSLLKQFGPLIAKALSGGKEGYEFAMDVESLMGVEAVSVLIKDGEEQLMEVAKSVPEFWNPLVGTYGEPHLVKWVHDLVNYKEIIAKMDAEEVQE